ncbi:hypothetical protein FDECE_4102 [Fusarium decemcellulare]|nr:hypothetical protein FDECE_4102 [Fusarium decemcellulare]
MGTFCLERARVQVMARHKPAMPDIPQIEALSTTANRIYEPHRHSFPTFGHRDGLPSKDDIKRLGLHSLYHLCQMVLLCPLVSLFSGHRQHETRIENNARVNAKVVAQHALQHCQLIRKYIAASSDLSKITPLTAFGSFVAASLLITLLKSSKRPQEESRRTFLHLARFVQDTSGVLDILQIYWKPLGPMAQELRRKAERLSISQDDLEGCLEFEDMEQIELPLTGVNSPIQGEDGITTIYVDTPECTGSHQSTVRTHPAAYLDPVTAAPDQEPNDVASPRNETATPRSLRETETFLSETMFGNCDEIFDFQDISDWDLDFFSLYPPQIA